MYYSAGGFDPDVSIPSTIFVQQLSKPQADAAVAEERFKLRLRPGRPSRNLGRWRSWCTPLVTSGAVVVGMEDGSD